MFGSIVSCTDPIAVVALLKELGAPKKLFYLFLDLIPLLKEKV